MLFYQAHDLLIEVSMAIVVLAVRGGQEGVARGQKRSGGTRMEVIRSTCLRLLVGLHATRHDALACLGHELA